MTLIDAFKAVFWSFFGVRKHKHYEADFAQLKPWQVIAAGLVSIVFFVLAIWLLVQLVTR
ncbi:MAG TPA: DUF2970 domain-containing protein [Casimicrobiaceae bacterium]|nr:DUF2970 domain-containing protein [Casimicrobiaceae bacterium]